MAYGFDDIRRSARKVASVNRGTVSHEVKEVTRRRRFKRTAPAPTPPPAPSIDEHFRQRGTGSTPVDEHFTQRFNTLVDEGTGLVPPVEDDPISNVTGGGVQEAQDYIQEITSPFSVDEFRMRFPGFSEEAYRAAAQTNLQFLPTLYIGPNKGAQYDPRSNTIKYVPGQDFGTLAHEFVHFAQTRAPDLLNPKVLTPEQRSLHNQTVNFMAARAGQTANSLTDTILLLGQIVNDMAGGTPIEAVGEREAFSIAGGQSVGQAFPARYFSDLFAGPRTAQRLRSRSVYQRGQ